MTGGERRFLVRLTAASVALVAVAAILPAAGISTSSKPFTATFLPPATFTPGGSGTWDLIIKDADHNGVPSSQPLGSAHITIPAAWTVNSVSAVGSSGSHWNASVNAATGQIELGAQTQNDRLTGGQSVDLTIKASTLCAALSPAQWPIAVKQSNNFLGSGNDFFLDGSTPALTAAAGAGTLAGFKVTVDKAVETAGVPFQVTATPQDSCKQQVMNYSPSAQAQVVLNGTLGQSTKAPNVADQRLNTVDPYYGGFTWANGVGTATVVAKKAESNQTVTITVTDPAPGNGSGVGTSDAFSVQPNPDLLPAFANQPGDAQVSNTIYNDIAASPPTNITVSVADAWGNAAPDGTNVSMTASNVLTNAQQAFKNGSTNPEATSSGVATFDNLSLAVTGTYTMTATVVSSSESTPSNQFEVVQNLAICDGKNNCNSPAGNGNQSANTNINSVAGTTFQGGVVLESSLIANPSPAACSTPGHPFTPIPGTSGMEAKVRQSGNLSTSQPTFTITFTVQKSVLKAAQLQNLGASQFDICLGAKRLDGVNSAWTTTTGLATFDPATGYYWGIVPNGPGGLPPNNPYISSEHKDGAGNLVIVLVKPYPWDGAWYGG
jgi:hypothetical protein